MPSYDVEIESKWLKTVESIEMQESLSLTVGETYTLSAVVNPDNAANKTVTWQSSNEAVAAVSKDGVIEARSEGSAVITASADGVSAECTVEVKSPIPITSTITPSGYEQRGSTVIIKLDTSQLPEGTKFIKTPDGSTIAVGSSAESISFEINQSFIGENGGVEIVALNDEQTPLGIIGMNIETSAQEEQSQQAAVKNVIDTKQPVPFFVWLLIAIAGLAGAGIAAYFIFRKRRQED